jgi:cell division septal protein FtsQ
MSPFRSSHHRQAGPSRRGTRSAPLRARGRVDGRPRARSVRRASGGLTRARLGALVVLVLSSAGLYGATTSDAFTLRTTSVTGALYASTDEIATALTLPAGQNLFSLHAGELVARLERIPAVRVVQATVVLPGELRVAITERQALLAWRVGTHTYVVDGTGFVMAELGADPPGPAAALPVVEDRRTTSTTLLVGATIDPVSLDAALRLGSLVPSDVGSGGGRLHIAYDDGDGFTLGSDAAGWTAIFGYYTPTLRTTELIPGQVRLLRSLILGHEASFARILLADDQAGTYLAAGSPAPSVPTASGTAP